MLRGIPDERSDWRAVRRADLSPRKGWRVAHAARCRKHGCIRQAIRARLTRRGRSTPRFAGRAQVSVFVHHRAGLRDEQREREKQAEPRGLPTAGQELGLCHTCEYSLGRGACQTQWARNGWDIEAGATNIVPWPIQEHQQ